MAIPLSNAWLCPDCELVVEATAAAECPKCLSKGLLALAKVLNRKPTFIQALGTHAGNNPICSNCGASAEFVGGRLVCTGCGISE